ncbi:hypothetical protein MTR67_032923 [Solanum verrucosum]|uniref:DUF4283 domain-containing protein n=1 Tax=Solanum verrucosum TaxID=315347 RepID=A0AAF0U5A9_SOLVR|nr:hypothetical protein MTR67_032923 [Solanum verrucosum]
MARVRGNTKNCASSVRDQGKCKIVFLRDRYVLIRLTTMEDYIHVMSKPTYFLRAKDGFYQMRPLKWEPWFSPEAETTTALAWISFPGLSPNFFVQESLFTMAKAVGKPLHVDMATKKNPDQVVPRSRWKLIF